MRRIAIIGGGPRGLSALEELFIEISRQSKEKEVIVSLFETSSNPGSGNVWNTDQLKTNWLNISERALKNLKKRESLVIDGLNILEFPSYTDWLPEEEQDPNEATPDKFPERSKLGTYLNDRFNSIAVELQMEGFLKVVKSNVTHIDYKEKTFSLETEDDCYEFDEVLLAVGHQPTKLSKQLIKWGKHEKTNPELQVFEKPYPVDQITSSAKITKDSTVAIRGFGLAMIDVMRALTIGRGAEFALLNNRTFESKFITNDQVPDKIITFSLDGEPMVPKPLNAKIDADYEPTDEEIETFGETIFRNAHGKNEVSDNSFLIEAISEITSRVYLDLEDKALAHSLKKEELKTVVVSWLNDSDYKNELIAPTSEKTAYKIKKFIEMALAKTEISLDYCIGQVWRHCQPTLYKNFSHSNLRDDVIASVIALDERIKRYSYGPPIESMQQMLSLVEADILDLELAADPEITEVKNGWKLKKDKSQHTAQIMINSVLDAPKIMEVTSPIICDLLSNNLIEPIHSELGINTHMNGCIEISEEKEFIPLAVLGRLAKGSVIGVDAILECFGSRVNDWAKAAAQRV